jgi:hypothetical protein
MDPESTDRRATALLEAAANARAAATGDSDPLIATLREWLADESGYDEETWPLLREALNRGRTSIGARVVVDE